MSSESDRVVSLTGSGHLTLGGQVGASVEGFATYPGEIELTDGAGQTGVRIRHATGREESGETETARIYLDGGSGECVIGGYGQPGLFETRDHHGEVNARLVHGMLVLGSGRGSRNYQPGSIQLLSLNGPNVQIESHNASLTLGGGASTTSASDGVSGRVILKDESEKRAGSIEADSSALVFKDAQGTPTLRIESGGVVKTANPVERI